MLPLVNCRRGPSGSSISASRPGQGQHMVLARIDDAPAGTRGISLFLVPKVLVNDDGTLGERNDVVTAGVVAFEFSAHGPLFSDVVIHADA